MREHYSRKDSNMPIVSEETNDLILPVVTESSNKTTVDAIIDE